jgi:hypothetical protein
MEPIPSPALVAQAPRWVKRRRSPQVIRRKAALRRSGWTMQALADHAGVSYSMAFQWMNGIKKSAYLARSFAVLVANPKVAAPETEATG